MSSHDNIFQIVTTKHIRNLIRQNAQYPAYSQPNTHNSFDMAQETSNNSYFQYGPIGMPQAQNISQVPMQAKIPEHRTDNLRPSFDSDKEDTIF